MEHLAGRRATILGLGREGVDLARFLVQRGARVRVSDRKPAEQLTTALAALDGLPIEYCLGGHPRDDVLDCDVLFVSPGVPQDLDVVQEAHRLGVPVSSATELFFQLCPAPIVGITGSSGKTTTTTLVGRMLSQEGRHVLVGGNIGVPLLARLPEITAQSWVVMELSSFQLETMRQSPHVGTITNITPNHLDRHPSMEHYIAAKVNIVRYQGPADWAVLNADDPVTASVQAPGRVLRFSLQGPTTGAYLDGDDLALRVEGDPVRICPRAALRLRGRHNVANALAACATAATVGVSTAAMAAVLQTFAGVPHRLEPVAEIDGVWYYNDSIATSPERSIAALESFAEPIVLIAGGRDKHLPMDRWAATIVRRARHVILLGEAAPLIARAVAEADPSGHVPLHVVGTMREAVRQAHRVAEPGIVVLLAPGCTSFDMFRDFEERGEIFRQEVRRLADEVARGEAADRRGA